MAEVAEGAVVDGRYTIERRLGSGGMADVYCAEDSQLGRQIALKVLHRRFARDREFVERFRREASAAAGLQHPNVVGVFDRGEYDGTYYIAMEYLPGRTLKDLIREEAPLDQLRAIDYAIQILQAASFAHRRGVIHRDFKPHNVIVADDDRLKVTDFGIARAGASEMTETGSIMGTAQYLSPEQAQGQRVGAPSDLYSIGVVLFEMLTARVPFTGESAVSIAGKHACCCEPPPLRQLGADLHPRLSRLSGRAPWRMRLVEATRSADEFIAALEQARTAIASATTAAARRRFCPSLPKRRRDLGGRRWAVRSCWRCCSAWRRSRAVAAALARAGGGAEGRGEDRDPRHHGAREGRLQGHDARRAVEREAGPCGHAGPAGAVGGRQGLDGGPRRVERAGATGDPRREQPAGEAGGAGAEPGGLQGRTGPPAVAEGRRAGTSIGTPPANR